MNAIPVSAPGILSQPLSIGGIALKFETENDVLAGQVLEWLARAFCIESEVIASQPPIRVRLASTAMGIAPPTGAKQLYASPTVRMLRDADRVYLLFEQARALLDLAEGRAELWFDDGWWRAPLKIQQQLWILALGWLLRERGRYLLHASTVAFNGVGVLIAGESGSGKSTTALSLIQCGWDHLADDAVMLEPGEPPRLRALARGFAFHRALAEQIPGLSGEMVDGKHFADIDALFPGRQISSCRPQALLFPRVENADRSHLKRLTPADALIALLPASGGILAGGAPQAHFGAMRDLVEGVPAWRLLAGRDIFGNGAVLEALLAEHGVGIHP